MAALVRLLASRQRLHLAPAWTRSLAASTPEAASAAAAREAGPGGLQCGPEAHACLTDAAPAAAAATAVARTGANFAGSSWSSNCRRSCSCSSSSSNRAGYNTHARSWRLGAARGHAWEVPPLQRPQLPGGTATAAHSALPAPPPSQPPTPSLTPCGPWRAASTSTRPSERPPSRGRGQQDAGAPRPGGQATGSRAAAAAAGAAAEAEAEEEAQRAEAAEAVEALTDLTRPASWYPVARALRRRVVAHLGPTNSGKTHAALQALRSAPSGMYAGPLRLLACEVADRLAAGGLPCHLVTGQEVRRAVRHDGRAVQHTACTIEMADVSRAEPYDVAVIDEIQMLADPSRGWAWTRALLGLPAAQLHVAGDPAALPLLRALVDECGDELQVVSYQRLSPLVVQGTALGGVGAAQPGDCLVAFSRRALHSLRREVVRRTGHEACMVYGALPPEARRQQAALFNGQPLGAAAAGATDGAASEAAAAAAAAAGAGAPGGGAGGDHAGSGPGLRRAHHRPPHAHAAPAAGAQGHQQRATASEDADAAAGADAGAGAGADADAGAGGQGAGAAAAASAAAASGASAGAAPARVLCASDAIGMGLNLAVRRIVFTSLTKFDGRAVRPLQASEVRQIAGRAGRFSSPHPAGYVTCLHAADLPALHAAMAERPQHLQRACLMPRSEDLASYAAHHAPRPLATSLLAFAAAARLSPSYAYCEYEPMYRIASALRHLEGALSHDELLLFSTAPADMDDPAVAAALLRFAKRYCAEGVVGADALGRGPAGSRGLPASPPQTEGELKRLEEQHRVYDLYVWLSYRMPYAFPAREEAESARARCGDMIEEGLDRLAAVASAAFGRRRRAAAAAAAAAAAGNGAGGGESGRGAEYGDED